MANIGQCDLPSSATLFSHDDGSRPQALRLQRGEPHMEPSSGSMSSSFWLGSSGSRPAIRARALLLSPSARLMHRRGTMEVHQQPRVTIWTLQ